MQTQRITYGTFMGIYTAVLSIEATVNRPIHPKLAYALSRNNKWLVEVRNIVADKEKEIALKYLKEGYVFVKGNQPEIAEEHTEAYNTEMLQFRELTIDVAPYMVDLKHMGEGYSAAEMPTYISFYSVMVKDDENQ